MIEMVLVGVWAVMLAAPETPIGRWLRRAFVEVPAARLVRVGRAHVILMAAAIALGAAVVWLFEGDGAQVLAMAGPEMLTWITKFEVATWVDVLVAVGMTTAGTRVAGLIAQGRAVMSGRRTPRQRRGRRTIPPPANDDDDRPVYAVATRRA